MKIERFEDLECWKMARQLANMIYDLTDQKEFRCDIHLRSQIRDASGSVMHNIAEGFDSGSDAEFIRFLRISRRSASEVQSQLYLALDRNYITENQRKEAYEKAREVKRLINGLIAYLRRSKTQSGRRIVTTSSLISPQRLQDEAAKRLHDTATTRPSG